MINLPLSVLSNGENIDVMESGDNDLQLFYINFPLIDKI